MSKPIDQYLGFTLMQRCLRAQQAINDLRDALTGLKVAIQEDIGRNDPMMKRVDEMRDAIYADDSQFYNAMPILAEVAKRMEVPE